MNEFFAMNGYGYYVWSAYGMTAIALVVELVALRARRRAAVEQTRLATLEAATDAAAAS